MKLSAKWTWSLVALVAVVLVVLVTNYLQSLPPDPLPLLPEVAAKERVLRKMTERMDSSLKVTTGYFLFVGGSTVEANTSVSVKFAWQMDDGDYAFSSLPLEKFRLKFADVSVPTIRFVPRPEGFLDQCYNFIVREMDKLITSECIARVVIRARESDWPAQVNLPLNE